VIQHVSLECQRADENAQLRFWALLGFERVEPPGTLAERSTWVARAGTQVHLLFAEEPVAPPQGHVAVVVGDYDGTVAALRAAGFDVDPRQQHWGAPRAFVRAPGGHRVELMASPPP
jgi:catechol 2,3-dioxygenase-like lactoylglutathione lyase family enzyme